jgi:hypothetical protein
MHTMFDSRAIINGVAKDFVEVENNLRVTPFIVELFLLGGRMVCDDFSLWALIPACNRCLNLGWQIRQAPGYLSPRHVTVAASS